MESPEVSKENKIDKNIANFLESAANMTLATSAENIPSCANCFYVFLQEHCMIVFKSSKETQHIQNALKNPNIAGAIIPDISEFGKIKGAQFHGELIEIDDKIKDLAKFAYYKKYPYALVMKGDLWAIQCTSIKMIDSTLGFVKKFQWNKQ